MKLAFLFGSVADPMPVDPCSHLRLRDHFGLLLSFRVRAFGIFARLKHSISSRRLQNLECWTPKALMYPMGLPMRPYLIYALSILKQCAHVLSRYEKDIVA